MEEGNKPFIAYLRAVRYYTDQALHIAFAHHFLFYF